MEHLSDSVTRCIGIVADGFDDNRWLSFGHRL